LSGLRTHSDPRCLRGTREPSDIAYYPRSNKVYFRGVGLMARIERLDYWDGEAD